MGEYRENLREIEDLINYDRIEEAEIKLLAMEVILEKLSLDELDSLIGLYMMYQNYDGAIRVYNKVDTKIWKKLGWWLKEIMETKESDSKIALMLDDWEYVSLEKRIALVFIGIIWVSFWYAWFSLEYSSYGWFTEYYSQNWFIWVIGPTFLTGMLLGFSLSMFFARTRVTSEWYYYHNLLVKKEMKRADLSSIDFSRPRNNNKADRYKISFMQWDKILHSLWLMPDEVKQWKIRIKDKSDLWGYEVPFRSLKN